MVLESLLSSKSAKKHPVTLFFMAFIVATIGMLIAYNSFPGSSSVLAIAFVAVAFMPIMHTLFRDEEEQEIDESNVPFAFISTHFEVIHIYSWIFLGLIVASAFWYVALPESNDDCSGFGCLLPEKGKVFAEQKRTYTGITGKIVGESECFNTDTKSFSNCFMLIFTNNTGVMILAIIFSFIWGAGAIFLLGWNASVVGFFIGSEVTAKSLESGLARAISYLPHGAPEILAYFLAAIIGGIISATISKQKFRPHELRIIFVDTILLTLLAIITLFIGAFIETAEIFGYLDFALLGLIALAVLYMVLYIPNIRYHINKVRN
ncbi:MAG: hypothetical protein COV47_03690 [Candidatus Diapherotrites archaeon CG11_big_fil_rev_8_21_14_0_20_37_9]|nr:MAG: hypothetical protein COV47_03690 [Candidatus Diapherotrites archaeon CG11_big_fil_rev_8_21_14_0_20_37_9]